MNLPAQPEVTHAWSQISEQLRAAVDESAYVLWLSRLELTELTDNKLTLSAPDDAYDWIASRYLKLISHVATSVFGSEAELELVNATDRCSGKAEQSVTTALTADFNPKYTFDRFVIGDNNHLAHAATLAVAELPGQAYNPLFIYGPPGQGKTHLLHSIANYLRTNEPTITVRYSTIEAFTNHFVKAIRSGQTDDFKHLYRANDVLLIDDIQFLASKAKTEEEFFHTFNALYETGAQLVLTSDRLPRDLESLEQRLLERFECGLVTKIERPNFTTRMTILKKLATKDALTVPTKALAVIARAVKESVRALEGALIRVVAYQSLTGRPLTAELATEVLSDLYPSRKTPCTVESIQTATCQLFDLSSTELLSNSRSNRTTWPRQVAMYLARQLTDETLPSIGQQFGGRNHSTVLHSCRTTSKRLVDDAEARTTVESLLDILDVKGHDRSC